MVIKKKIEKVIDKGGSVKDDQDDPFITFQIRMRKSMLKEVDSVVSNNVGISRNGWILQVISGRLKYGGFGS